jgi:hypothetical protein
MTPADLLAKNSIEEQIKTSPTFCFKGYVDSGRDWQAQTHQKTDALLSYTLGPMDDSNGVGPVGKTIEVIAYDVHAWDSKLNRTVSSGPDIAWFAMSRDSKQLEKWSQRAAAGVVYVVALMSTNGRLAK